VNRGREQQRQHYSSHSAIIVAPQGVDIKS
jgi:hypothetical protein